MTPATIANLQQRALALLDRAQVVLDPAERRRIEVCDYHLGDVERIGTQILIYVNTQRCCAKEIILLPWQICPEHLHPAIGDYPGKEETFRCRWGEVYLYVPGAPTAEPRARLGEGHRAHCTVWHEIVLRPGQQYTLREQTRHWFQAGADGAVVSEFSTQSFDSQDVFTDPAITRLSNIVEGR